MRIAARSTFVRAVGALRIAMSARTVAAVAAALTLTLQVSPSAQTSPAPLQVPYSTFTLPNGLRVILHEDHSVPLVTVNVWYHVGSANERPGRTGFAHLFEHLMFMGSKHVGPGVFDTALSGAGGLNNASTSNDRTNYWMNVPANSLELALFLESDRMAYMLDTMTPKSVDAQREVVKNERRQRIENAPYGMAGVTLLEMLFPEGHPYHWPVIGYMDDLSAASYDDVVNFYKQYYAPSNASLVVAGDIDPIATRALVEKWFGEVRQGTPPPPMASPAAVLTEVQKKTLTDRVQLPRIYLAWLTPRLYAPGDAALDLVSSMLTGGKNSRLYKRLVYDLQIAQDVQAYQASLSLGSYFVIQATARPGQPIEKLQALVDEELQELRREAPSAREVERALNQIEAAYYSRLEHVGGGGGKADQLNSYFMHTGNPDWFNEDLARYRALSPTDVRAAADAYLPLDRRVELTVVPEQPR
jgi:zinc protease